MAGITTETVEQAAAQLKSLLHARYPIGLNPVFGIVGGSGLAVLEETLQDRLEISYGEIEGFTVSTVPGHNGKLVFGFAGVSSIPVVLMSGRAHYYEGHDLQRVTFPIRVLGALGIKVLITTNAAGGLNREYKVGDIVLIQDHLNFVGLAGTNPLRGATLPGAEKGQTRFVPLSDAYDLGLRRAAHQAWEMASPGTAPMHEGVYAFVGGPNYETRAESRMLSALGADLVGMSTVPEIIVARHCNIRVLGISVITNNAVKDQMPRGDDPRLTDLRMDDLLGRLEVGKADHLEVLEHIKIAAETVKRLIVATIDRVSQEIAYESF